MVVCWNSLLPLERLEWNTHVVQYFLHKNVHSSLWSRLQTWKREIIILSFSMIFFKNLSSKHQSYLFWSDFRHLLNVLLGKKRSLIGAFFSGKPVRVISQGYKRSLTLPHGEPNKVQLWVVRWKRNGQKRGERI